MTEKTKRMLRTLFYLQNSRDGVVPEDADRFGSLLRLQHGVLQGDGWVQDGRKGRILAVHRGAHYGCVDHWTVGESGKTLEKKTKKPTQLSMT